MYYNNLIGEVLLLEALLELFVGRGNSNVTLGAGAITGANDKVNSVGVTFGVDNDKVKGAGAGLGNGVGNDNKVKGTGVGFTLGNNKLKDIGFDTGIGAGFTCGNNNVNVG